MKEEAKGISRLNKGLIGVSISVGVLAGSWILLEVIYGGLGIKVPLDLKGIGVAGFLGWATFYAAGGKNIGFKSGLVTNLTGVCWGILIVLIWTFLGTYSNYLGALVGAGIGAAGMCFQAHIKQLGFIPGAFIGCSTFFALGATISLTVILPTVFGLIIGLSLGWISEAWGGKIATQLGGK
ncbi:DUF1097 domain-containing protein [Formosa sp. PL04]|uniref:DUF1097 domain-containing protein n=1 Tax=Formosa sp. PL04 TaxID=3081755 RepID=UPI0029817BA7|nr:DUF1097 domain-containing protein [Formosa sp. PL04]MDW5289691.1 DUF1097 domain-containing protein [Formosa sp. PL04]